MARKWWTLTLVCVAAFMLLLDITIVNVAVPEIQNDLGASLSSLQWVIDAYALTLAAFLLVAGSIGDRVGRRRVFSLGFGLFTVASLVATVPRLARRMRLVSGRHRGSSGSASRGAGARRVGGDDATPTADALDRGRESFGRRAWADAFAELWEADRVDRLAPDDLERLATAAYLAGRDEDSVELWERAHRELLGSGDVLRAARCAGWLVFVLVNGREVARSSGWIARTRRLLDDGRRDCPELGYVLVPTALLRAVQGDWPGAHALAGQAAEMGERFGESDLVTLARNVQGRALIAQQRVDEGMTVLDEAMVAVTAGEVSPMVAVAVFSSVIEAGRQVFELGGPQEG